MKTPILDAALEYAALGWCVFPCKGKQPITKHGCKEATKDTEQIRKWWRSFPNANVAIATGEVSGLYIIDQDVGGEDVVAKLGLPVTRAAITPSGGRHYYFSRPNGEKWPNTVGKIGAHVDTRGDGGYVIAPPSPGYSWEQSW